MASTKRIDDLLSPREQRLMHTMRTTSGWIDSLRLCVLEYGEQTKKWPLHARNCITGTMGSIERKLNHHGAAVKLIKRGGGRAGVEYKLQEG